MLSCKKAWRTQQCCRPLGCSNALLTFIKNTPRAVVYFCFSSFWTRQHIYADMEASDMFEKARAAQLRAVRPCNCAARPNTRRHAQYLPGATTPQDVGDGEDESAGDGARDRGSTAHADVRQTLGGCLDGFPPVALLTRSHEILLENISIAAVERPLSTIHYIFPRVKYIVML